MQTLVFCASCQVLIGDEEIADDLKDCPNCGESIEFDEGRCKGQFSAEDANKMLQKDVGEEVEAA